MGVGLDDDDYEFACIYKLFDSMPRSKPYLIYCQIWLTDM